MNIIKYQMMVAAFFGLCCNGHAQGFVNLNFEDAVIVLDASSSYYPYAVYANDALPGWTIYNGFVAPNEILYNTISLGAPSVAILGTNGIPSALAGDFSVDLYGGSGSPAGVSINQTGLVPNNAMALLFKAQSTSGTMIVTLGGQSISFAAISIGPNYTLYGGNIPLGIAGQNAELEFYAPYGVNNYWELDDIQFSSSPVPEPSTLALSALCGLALVCRRRRKAF